MFLYRFKTKKHRVNGLLFEIMGHKVGWVPPFWSILAIFGHFGHIIVHKLHKYITDVNGWLNTSILLWFDVKKSIWILQCSFSYENWAFYGIFWSFRGLKLPYFWPVLASYSHLFRQVSHNCTQIDCIFICFIILLNL